MSHTETYIVHHIINGKENDDDEKELEKRKEKGEIKKEGI